MIYKYFVGVLASETKKYIVFPSFGRRRRRTRRWWKKSHKRNGRAWIVRLEISEILQVWLKKTQKSFLQLEWEDGSKVFIFYDPLTHFLLELMGKWASHPFEWVKFPQAKTSEWNFSISSSFAAFFTWVWSPSKQTSVCKGKYLEEEDHLHAESNRNSTHSDLSSFVKKKISLYYKVTLLLNFNKLWRVQVALPSTCVFLAFSYFLLYFLFWNLDSFQVFYGGLRRWSPSPRSRENWKKKQKKQKQKFFTQKKQKTKVGLTINIK